MPVTFRSSWPRRRSTASPRRPATRSVPSARAPGHARRRRPAGRSSDRGPSIRGPRRADVGRRGRRAQAHHTQRDGAGGDVIGRGCIRTDPGPPAGPHPRHGPRDHVAHSGSSSAIGPDSPRISVDRRPPSRGSGGRFLVAMRWDDGRPVPRLLRRIGLDQAGPRGERLGREQWLWSSTATELLVMKRHKRGPVLRNRSTNTDPRSSHVTCHGRALEPDRIAADRGAAQSK